VAKKYMTARKSFTNPPGNRSTSSIPFLKPEMVSVFILHPLVGQAALHQLPSQMHNFFN
jgi:hypothetical protein